MTDVAICRDENLESGRFRGVEQLAADPRLLAAIREFDRAGKWLGAICAGPLVLQAAGILGGRQATCHPAAAAKLTATGRRTERVVVDRRLVTSQGPGTSFDFALTMVRLIDGAEQAATLADSMVLREQRTKTET